VALGRDAMMHLQMRFYDGWRFLDKQVKPVFWVREIPDSIRKVQPPFRRQQFVRCRWHMICPVGLAHEMSALWRWLGKKMHALGRVRAAASTQSLHDGPDTKSAHNCLKESKSVYNAAHV
jgi:hypothetical protein